MSIMRLGYKKFGLGYALIILSVVFLSFGIKNARAEDNTLSEYISVPALVTEKEESPDGMTSALTLSYADLSGNEYSRKMLYSGSANVGDVIEIKMNTYNPRIIGDPKDVEAVASARRQSGGTNYAAQEIAVGAVMLTAGVILLVRRIRRDRLIKQLEE